MCTDIGLNKSSGTKWKNGSSPDIATLNKIADYFAVPTSYLLGNEPKEKSSTSELDTELINKFELLSDDGKTKALDYIKLLLEARK